MRSLPGPAGASDGFGARFLKTPDLFPARIAGETIGDGCIVVDLPGGPYCFQGLSGLVKTTLENRYDGWIRSDPGEEDAVRTTLFRARDEFLDPEACTGEYTLDLSFHPEAVLATGLGFMTRIILHPHCSAGLWIDDRQTKYLEGAIENYLRVLVAFGVLARGGLVLHSAGVRCEDDGYLFLGSSGSGKSTIARLSRGDSRQLLSDDLNALVPREGEVDILALPFAGDLPVAGKRRVPLRRLIVLRQGSEHALNPVRRSLGVARLLSCSCFVNRDPHRLPMLWDIADHIAGSTRFEELMFCRDAGFWNLLTREGS